MDPLRQQYRQLDPNQVEAVCQIKESAEHLYNMLVTSPGQPPSPGVVGPFLKPGDPLDQAFMVTADPRCMALARTALEEAVMWATKGIS